jgi:hypothetical protein
MSTLYSQQQIIFALNSIANAPSGRHGTVDQLQSYAKQLIIEVFSNSDVIKMIGEWNLVWGVQVFQAADSSVADNAMYVAQNGNDSSEFVVAISGTNPISAYGWIVEDAMLVPTVPWTYNSANSASTGKITKGTNTGLKVLLNTLTDDGLSLSEFLARQVANQAKPLSITLTGHSLGGALSPVVALALLDTQGIPVAEANGWDPDSTTSIRVQPSAGPTPGNQTWRNYYDNALGTVTDRLWNAIDMVPHAWQLSMLAEIPTLYVPTIAESSLVKKLLTLAEVNSTLAGNMQQICPSTRSLPGKVDTSENITLRDFEVLLETLIANEIIDKLGLPKLDQSLIKQLIDDWIKHLNKQADSNKCLHEGAILLELEQKALALLKDLWSDFSDFIDFLKQAAYQHTTAYSILLGTQTFESIVEVIKKDGG